MSDSSKYYKDISLIRVIACLAVILYHLNILNGGYLAVCSFFVLSGYLSCISLFKKEKISLKEYYIHLVLKTYLPLLIVVFLTIAFVSFFPSIKWLNLKPETTSVLLNYNNYWQLSANLDYFARHINSPFIHLWYISILMQFDLVLPFVFIVLKKLGNKIHKIIPCIITLILSLTSAFFFYKSSISRDLMVTYYDTFSRIFSLLFGLTLGFIHSYYRSLCIKSTFNSVLNRIIFFLYFIILVVLFIFIDINSSYWSICMILVTLITCRLIDYGTINTTNKLSIVDSIFKYLSKISYGIYLFQYPLIFILNYFIKDNYVICFSVIVLTLLLSALLYFGLNKNTNKYLNVIRGIIFVIGLVAIGYGGFQFYLAKDYTEEMNLLKEQLANNTEIFKKHQEEYLLQKEQEELDWQKVLDELEIDENNLKNVVTNLPVIGIGDSVMLGAVGGLYQQFPNGYFDAQISRTAWVVNDILKDLKSRNLLNGPLILNLGANGDCSEYCKQEIIATAGDREIFWVNTTNDSEVFVNDALLTFANKYNNVHIIDWNAASKGYPEYFYADGIHLTPSGVEAYTKTIYDAIYQVYFNQYQNKKEEVIKEHEAKEKNRISFYGNDVLLNIFDYIKEEFSDANVIIDSKYTYESIYSEIEKTLKEGTITNKIVLAFDSTIALNVIQYKNLINLCGDREVYILLFDKQIVNELSKLVNNKVNIIDFSKVLNENGDYLMVDGIHLSNKGNQKLIEVLKDSIL